MSRRPAPAAPAGTDSSVGLTAGAAETEEQDGLDLSEHGESMLEAGKAAFLLPINPATTPRNNTVHPDMPSATSNDG
jgi:hypothetical protein